MTKGTHLLRSALLALLGLVVISGASFASDLFDDDYDDCPYQTRLRDGQIADLAVARDSDDADHINVSWSATEAATWGLGPNAYNTSLVVLLDDDDDPDPDQAKTLHLGSRKVTFEDVKTGKSVKVQMAIVVDHADGDYLISDILEQSIDQSLSKPAFGTGWNRVTATADSDNDATNGFQYTSEAIGGGMMYFIGYNENFGNVRSGTATISTDPSTARLRIGLAHSTIESKDDRDGVDFEAYIIRIEDGNGDRVDEGDDVATVASNYGSTGTAAAATVNRLFVDDLGARPTFDKDGTIFSDTDNDGVLDTNETDHGVVLFNVRIVDGKKISEPMHNLSSTILPRADSRRVLPNSVSITKVGPTAVDSPTERAIGDIFANPPDEHRDFPIDTFTTDVTYKISAWAVNDDDEVISPVATITIVPSDKTTTLGGETLAFNDYNNSAITSGTVIVTRFTVQK